MLNLQNKEVKEKVIRADQLVKYIKDMYGKSKEAADSDERMLVWAQTYLDLNNAIAKDYTKKYEQYKINAIEPKNSKEEISTKEVARSTIVDVAVPVGETHIFKEFKLYRLSKSREENIKPYFIYNDNQLKDLISKMPRNKEDLQTVAGFGEAKVNKYGNDILSIVGKY